MGKIPGYNDHKELSTERFRLRMARNNLRHTVDNLPRLKKKHGKHDPWLMGFLEASVEEALEQLDLFAKKHPDFITW